MSHKKILLVAVFLTGFIFTSGVIPSDVKAMTALEIQAQINALLAQIATLQQQLVQTEGEPVAWCHTFKNKLRIGDSGEEIKALRTALTKEGFLGLEAVGGAYNFDEVLASAVVGFQEKYKEEILSPWRLQHGTGFVSRIVKK